MVEQWTPLGKAAQEYFEKMLIEDPEIDLNKSRLDVKYEIAEQFRLTISEYARWIQNRPI